MPVPPRQRPLLEDIERRILYSADTPAGALAAALPAHDSASAQAQAQAQASPPAPTQAMVEIVVIDARVADAEPLLQDIAAQGRRLEVLRVDAEADGIAAISAALAGREDVAALHIVSHGGAGEVQLGRGALDNETLLLRAADIAGWGSHLAAGADILLYGCDVAGNDDGRALVQGLAALTGADVAASSDRTGAAIQGGNWTLEMQTGAIEAQLAFGLQTQALWQGVLATYTVTSTADTGAGTLRQAILDANANAGADTIVFNIAGAGLQTINLTSALPTITGTVTVNGYTQSDAAANTSGTGSNAVIRIALNGAGAGAGANGLNFGAGSTGSSVSGLAIGGFTGAGILSSVGGLTVTGNFIGTNAAGTTASANATGVSLAGTGATTIGGSTAAARNLIAGNTNNVVSSATGQVLVQGNLIGTTAAGTAALAASTTNGVSVSAGTATQIGGVNAGEGNVIMGGAKGVVVTTTGTVASVLGNTIAGVSSIGIDLGNDGATANDTGDADTGPNGLQNFPVLTAAQTSDSNYVAVQGTLNSIANTSFRIEFYATPSGTSTAEGRVYLGYALVTTNGSGNATIAATLTGNAATGALISATATRTGTAASAFFETSEFSAYRATTAMNVQTVTNTDDAGAGSLRAAITAANAASGPTLISFNISGDVVHTITLASLLPTITKQVIIDGTTDTGSVTANGGRPAIVINVGGIAGDGLRLDGGSSGSTIRGLVIQNYASNNSASAIRIMSGSSGNTIVGNYLGAIGANGEQAAGMASGDDAIWIQSSNNIVGGATAADRNVLGLDGTVAGFYAILIEHGNGNQILGNYAGVNASGTTGFTGLQSGIWINGSSTTAANTRIENNLISGAGDTGIAVNTGGGGTLVLNNRIGINAAGTGLISTAPTGIIVHNTGAGLQIIGNWIGSTAAAGMSLTASANGVTVQGNRIGTDLAGTANWGGRQSGIRVDGSNNLIGGTSPGQGNVIAFSNQTNTTADAISVASGTGNAILGNSIYGTNLSAGSLGIDLGASGVTPNDPGDADTGANNLQNFPVLTVARTDGAGNFQISGTLNSEANSYYRIEVFSNTTLSPNGYGEGRTLLGFVNVQTDASGNATFSTTLSATVAAGAYISATATKSVAGYGSFSDTSEFARSVVAISSTQAVVVVDTANDSVNGDTTSLSTLLANKGADGFISLREALIAINNTPAGSLPTLVNFNISGSGAHTIQLGSELPSILRPVVIDGTTDTASFAANGNRPAIVLQGDGSGNWNGFTLISGSGGSTVRGLVLQGFHVGISLQNGSDGNTIVGNYIGGLNTAGDLTGTLNNNFGIAVRSANNQIGGLLASERNVISGNTTGIDVYGTGVTGNRIQGNYIGTNAAGVVTGSSGSRGIWLNGQAANNLIGGTAQGAGNLIAGINGQGVSIDATALAGNAVLGNLIHSNAALGIDLGGSGVTPNDPGDVDTGANNLQNFPVLTLARTDNWTLFEINGTINTTANTHLRIEVFANTENGPSGYGQGKTFLGFVDVLTDGAGNASFTKTFSGLYVEAGSFISATATRADASYTSFSDTSEFARSVVAISGVPFGRNDQENILVVDTASDTVDGDTTSLSTLLASKGSDGFISLREAIIAINNTPAGSLPTFVHFDIAGTGVHTITLGSALPDITKPVFIDGSTDDSFAANGNRPAVVLQGNGAGSNWVGLNFTGGSGGSTVHGLVIRGFDYAIRLQFGSDGNTITGNYLGPLQANGSYTSAASAETTWGVSVESANNTIGGTLAADRNVISGMRSAGAGVALQGWGATGNRVIGNYLGTNASGTPLGVGADGVYVRSGAHDNQIGGTAAGEGNLIAGAGQRGIWIESSGGAGNAILGNSIHSNSGLGIDLGSVGVTPNDPGDADTGANNLQNFPVLATVGYASNQFTVTGSLNSEANKTYRIEFFGIPYGSTDGSGNGEGNVFLDFVEVTTDASGNASFSRTLAAAGLSYGAWISSTATEKTGASSYGSTSEFSANVQAANQAPVLTVAANAAYTENAVAVALAPSATVVDTELAAAGNYAGATLTLLRNGGANAQDLFAATGGSLSALTQGGNLVYGGTTVGTVTTNSGGTLVLSFNGNATQTLVNNVLRAIGYANSSEDPPASVQLNWSFSDGNTGAQGGGGALAGTGSTTVNITAVNDAPVVTTSGGTLAYTENAVATAIDAGLTVSDVDNANLTGATITISANYANGQDVLAFVNANGITGSWNAAAGVLTLSGTATVANYQAALRSVTYVNTSDNPSTATRTVSFVANDGATNSAAATRNIAVTAVNDAPVVTTTGTALAYTENATATAVDAGLTVSDADNTNLTGATVRISANYVNGQDVLAFTNQLGITGSWNATTGVLTLSGTTTVANYQTALRSITYVNTSDNPSTATRTVSFTATDGALTSTAATRNITVTAVNDAPVVTTTGTTLGYTENAAATAVDPGLTVSDVDNANLTGATVSISANYVNGEDVLAFVNANGITGSWNAATGVLTLSGTATVANYQAALRSITYVNTSDNPSTATRTVSFTATDGALTSTVATRNITVTAVNDAPVVTTTGTTLGYTENAAATAVDPALSVSDVDSANLTGATVSISANYVNGEDVLAFVNANGITGSWNAATGTLTLSGSATVANYQAALRSITYVNTSDNPSTATRTVSFTATDGALTSTVATRNITVTAVNDAPVVTTTGTTLGYTENAVATAVDPGLAVSDVDSANLTGATVSISANYVNGEDVLAFVNANGITGSWNAATGTLTLSGSATVANYQAALRSITYANTSENPSTATRTVSFTATDGAATSTVATRNIAVTAVNDAPVVTTTGGSTAYTENGPATAIDTGLTVSDVDNTTLAGATVTISANYVNGQDVLGFVAQNGITGSWNAATGVLTLSGTATVANYQAALRSITYANTSENPSTATRTVSFVVNDGTANSTAATRDVSVTAVNDAPVVTTTGGTTAYTENAAPAAIDTGVTVSDVDSTTLVGATVTISGNYVNGEDVLAFTNAFGITGSWNAATGTLTLSGSATVANYQAALRSVTYANSSENPSTATRTVSFVVNDGTANSTAATRDVSVAAVNDAPVVTTTGGTAAYTENAPATAIDTGVTVSDADNTTLAGATVTISGNYVNGQDVLAFVNANGITGSWDAATGTLTLSGIATVANYQAALRSITYANTSDNPSTATRTVSFVVNDGTANSTAATRDVSVAAVNDAPVVTTTGGTTAYTENAPATAIDPGVTVSDVDNTTLAGATVSISANYVNGEDVLAFVNANGITGSWNAATGTLTLSGSSSVANYQAALRSITYANTSENPSTATRTVSFTVNDGTASSTAATRNVSVAAVNDAPVVTTTGGTTAYTENTPATAIDTGLTVSDVDNTTLAGATVTISANYVNGQDVLAFVNANGITGSWDAATGTLTLSGSASVANYQAALRSITYVNTSDNPSTATRTVSFVVNDGAANSAAATRDVSVTAVNNAPVVTTTGGTTAYTENAPAAAIDPGLTVSDADSTNLTGATVTISANYVNGQDVLAFVNANGITGSWDAATGTLTLSGSASVANYQAALRSITYVNTSDNPSTATRTVSFVVNDGTANSTAATRDVSVAAVNDAPVVTTTGGTTAYTENAPATAIDTGLTVSDVDNATLTGATVSISANYANGQDLLGFVDQNGITGSWNAATGTLTLSGSSSLANYQAALRSITYTNTSDNPSTATRTVSFTVSDGTATSAAATRDVSVTAVNNAPVVTTTGGTTVYTENAAPTAVDPGLIVSDADNTTLAGATVTISGNYVNGQDVLAFVNANGITGSWDAATGTLTLSGSATVANYQAALRSVTYVNTSENPSAATRTVSFTVSDGTATSAAATRDVSVTAVNNAPVVTTTGGTTAYTENAAPTAIDTGLTVSDADNTTLTGATVTISANYVNGEDVLAFVNANGITGSWDAATGTLTLSGSATVANYQAALRSITYVNTSENPSTATRTVSFVVNDGTVNSAAATRDVSVTAVNDAPVVTTTGGTTAYTENAAPTAIDTGLTVSDADNTTLTGATVTISANYVNGQDVLAFVNANGITGSWDAATGTLTLSGSATVANYQAALRSITYVNTSDNPSTATRTVSFTVSDGTATSAAATRDISVTAVNNAPVVTTTGGTTAYTENAPATAVDPGVTVSDADNTTLTGATITISGNYVNGQDVLAFVDQNGITGSWNATTGTLTLSGSATVANYQAALRSITYANTSENPSTATRTVSFVVNDGATNSAAATRDITVTAVNDAPVITTTSGTTAYTENTPATAIDPGLTVSDADNATLAGATVTISANYVNGQDVLAFTNANGITGSWDAATGTLTLSGSATVANYQAALRSITYANTSENPSTATRTVSFVVNDGTASSTAATRNVSVAAVNDAPVVTTTGGTTTYTENAAPTAIDTGLTVSDADNTTLMGATVTISANYVNGEDVLAFVNANGITGSWNAASGVLTLTGTASVANYQAALRSITYANTSENPSTATRTVSFVVSDGTASSAAATRDVSVAAVNNAPVVTTTGGTTAYTENTPATVIDTSLTVSDADNTTLTGATVTISANYVNGQDVLGFVAQNGITGSWNAATGVLTLSGTATVANYQAALRSVTYVNTSENPSTATRTVSFVVNDGTVNSAAATRDVSVTAVNDAPVVTTTGGTTAYTENAPATAVDTGVTVSDVDSTTLTGATVTISANYVNGQDVLAFVNANGITGSWDATTGTLTLSGSATVANYQAALRSITYANTSDNPNTATRTVSFVVNDGTANSTAATRDVSVAAVNNAPVVTTTGGTTAYTENATPTAIDTGLIVSDADNTTLTGATVTISANYVNGQDTLAFTNANGITGSWNAATGTLTLSGSATVANYQAALRSVTYVNTSDNPSTATRTVSFVVNDGTANSATATRDVSVTAVNNAPVVTTTGGTTTYTENAAPTAIDTGLTVSDADNTTLTGATVTISANYVNGQDVLAFVSANGITGSWNAATGVLTLSGTATVANYQAALRSITYVNTSDDPSIATRTVSFVANDGTANSATATRDIAVTAVNNAPVVTTTAGTTAYTENAPATAVDTGLTVSDTDSTNMTGATVTISANYVNGQDVLGFVNQNGITGSWNAATGVLTLSGSATMANYQAALRSITYANTSNDPSTATRTVSFVVNDGTTNSAAATRDIAVTAVNNAPVITSNGGGATAAISIPENQTAVTTVTATDVDSPVLSYSISGGADAALFSIDANTGVLRFITAPNYEAPADAGGNNVYDVVVQVSDGSATATQAIAVTVTDVAEFGVGPVTDVDNAPNQVPENATNGTVVGITAHATDPDVLDTVSYSLSDSAGGRFTIDAVTGVVTVANGTLLDYESATSHQITVIATSSDGTTSTADFTITLTDVNEAPVGAVTDVDAAANQVPENAANGTAVGITAHAVDPDGTATVSYTLSDNAGGRFAINATTGVVTVANGTLLDYETATSHQITVVATSSDGSTSSASFTIALTDVSETAVGPVTDVDVAPNQVPENATNGTVVGITAHATDPDVLDTVAYSLSNDAGGRFTIDAVTGVVTVANGSLLDYESATSHQITVLATSSDGSTSSANFTIALTDVNEASVGPVTDVDAAPNQVAENAANGTAVGITAHAVDPDGTATVSYSLSDTAGGRFAINATTGVVTVANGSLLDYESATSHQITVVATSSDGSTSSANFTIALTDVGETAVGPVTDVDAAPNQVPENAATGTPVGITAHATDPDVLDTVAYSLSNDAGGRFTIDAVTGVVTVANGTLLDYESATSHQITVIATSSDGSTSSANFTIALTDVSEAPVGPVTDVDAAPNQVAENAANGTAVGITAHAVDPDGTATVSYSLSDSAGGRFVINATTGVVTVANASLLDHGANASHSITVLATSSDGSSTSASFNIAVLDAGGAAIGSISDADADSNQVQQGAPNGSPVGITALAVDPDGDSVAYSLTDNAGGRFTIDAVSGVVTVADGSLLDAAVAASHAITVRATSADGSFSERIFNIAVLAAAGTGVGPVNDTDPAGNRVAENAPNGTPVGITAQAIDPDGDAVHYTLSDSAGGRFTIDASTGVVTVADGSRLDYEAATSHRITVLATSSDGSSSSRNFTIALTDVNEFSVSPLIDVNSAPDQVRIPAANGTPVGITAFAQDLDGTDTVYYSLSDSAAGRFTINALSGVVTVADSARLGDATGYTITVRATSSDGSTSERSFAIAVPNANVQPPVITSPDRVAVPENTSGTVLRVSASDPDSPADTLVYSIAGGADAARFTIDARTGELRFATPPDYEQPGDANADNRYEVRVRVSDGRQAAEQALSVEVTPVNDNVPRFTTPGGVVEVDENTVEVTQLQATDDDRPVETLHYSIVGGADAARFTIDALSGALRFVHAPDYEAPDDADGNGHYELVVAVSDGTHSSQLALTVRVRDVPDSPPVFPDSTQHVAVPEMQSEVTTVTATDPDNLTVRYSIAGGPDGALFGIDAESGRLWFRAPPQFQLPRDADGNNVYEVLVQASNRVAWSTHTVYVTVLGSAVGTPTPTPVPSGPQPQPGTVAPAPVPTPVVVDPALVQPTVPGTSGGGTHETGGDYGAPGEAVSDGGEGQLPLGAPDPIYAGRTPGTGAAPGLGLAPAPVLARSLPVQPHWSNVQASGELPADLWSMPVLQPYVDALSLPGVDARRTEVELVDVQVVATGAGDDANALREAQAGLDEALIGGVVISLGAAFWATRGGALLASLLTMSPAWVHMDPLPVLSRRRRAERKPTPPAALAADGPEHNGARPAQAVAEDKT